MAHRVTLIPGDGTGPEIAEATRRVLEASGAELAWDVQQAGADVMEKFGGNPLPDHVLDSIKQNGVALKGPITTPVGTGFRSVNVALRKTLDLYGRIEFEEGSSHARDLIDWVEHHGHPRLREDSGISLKPLSVAGSRRIVEFAFDYARRNGRRKVTAVHKANIMKFTDGLFLRIAREVADE